MPRTLALAVDFGGTKVESALVDDEGRVLEGSRFRGPTGSGRSADELLEAVLGVARQALAALPADAELVGTGVAAAGPVDVGRGLVSPLNVPAWRGFPLRDRVAELTPDVPVTLQMDGLAITLAEHWIGAGRGHDHVMGMIVSTGIGGGLVLGGRTAAGSTGNAGHVGHLHLQRHGHVEVAGFDDPCTCGGRGCVEAVASGPKSVAWARAQGWTGSTGEDLAAGYRAGDRIAVAAVQRAGLAIGRAIASASSLVDLDVVAIGGGFSRVTPDLFDMIREPIALRTQFGFVTKTRVVPSGLSEDGPIVGAGALVHRREMVPSF
jgi:glucokinase